jgi:hypothetical protein
MQIYIDLATYNNFEFVFHIKIFNFLIFHS